TSVPTIDLVGGGGTGATAVALIQPAVLAINLTNGGSGYTSVPAVELLGGGGIGATASATVSGGTVTAINITNRGVGYTTPPTVQFSGGGGSGAAATALVSAGVREYLMHVITSGKYAVTELGTGGTPSAWVFVNDIQANLDLFWSLYHSLYVSQLYLTAGHG